MRNISEVTSEYLLNQSYEVSPETFIARENVPFKLVKKLNVDSRSWVEPIPTE